MNDLLKPERRILNPRALELREDEAKKKKLAGYAAVFNTESVDFGFFTEVIRPGAFARSIKEKADVRALIDHDPSLILGRTVADTLTLREDATGLYMEISPLPDTQVARDILENIRLGNVTQMSFGFFMKEDRWSTKDGKDFREIIDVDLYDVSIVTYPAYPQTIVNMTEARSVESVFQAHQQSEKPQDKPPTLLRYWELKQKILELDLES